MTPSARSFAPVERQSLEEVAAIMGPHSAAAKVLADAVAREVRGEAVAFYRRGIAILVGPANKALPQGLTGQ